MSNDADFDRWWRGQKFINDSGDADYYGEAMAAKTIIADRREVVLIAWSASGAALSVGPPGFGSPGIYDDQWLYIYEGDAFRAFQTWHGEGEPEGWFRHPSTGRRRTGGDPAKEYLQW